MPATDFQGSSAPFAAIGRSILSIRRDQVHAMDGHDGELSDIDAFQRHVADLFGDLAASGEELLSISWVRKLLDAFVVCLEEFRVILFNHRGIVARPPLDRIIAEFFERGVKALDVCNAVRDGVDQVRRWRKHLEIVLVSLDPDNRALGEGHLRRAKKALADLTVLMLDEKDASSGSSGAPHRNRSFGRNSGVNSSSSRDNHNSRNHFRSLSWSVSRTWSAARQLQAIGNAISAPRNHEIGATSGLAVPVYTMNSVLLFVMWSLVAAIPCQDRGLQAHFSIPRSFPWAAPIMSLHDRILEESKKKERRHSNGLLKEILQTERCAHQLSDLIDGVQLPAATDDKVAEMRQSVEELSQVCDAMKEGLDPMERQVREVFLLIVRSRTEGFDSLSHNAD